MPGTDRSQTTSLRSMALGLKDRRIAVLHQGVDTLYDIAENLPTSWPGGDPIGRRDAEVFLPELATILAGARTDALRRGGAVTVEAELRNGSNAPRLFEISVIPDIDGDGSDAGFVLVVTDITETREREQALTSLMREVSHRSKNLLAIVQAVAMQTANHSDTTPDFLAKFRGRLHALAGTQDLVTESDWRGTRLRQLATSQFSRLGQPTLDAITVDGLNPLLGPNASLHVGLAIHELATNALLHGALAEGRHGNITLTARKFDGADGHIVIEWREMRPDSDAAPALPHFGTLVLKRIVPLAIRGTADYEFGPTQVTYRLSAPTEQLSL